MTSTIERKIVFCGVVHTFIHCEEGLYSFGCNEYGQLGIGNRENQSKPQKTLFDPNEVASVSCGSEHTFVHCKDGLYSFGKNISGQLGIGNNLNQSKPQRIPFNPNEIISVSCRGEHTFIHCKDGLYSFGRNDFGQLGIGNKVNQSNPQRTPFNPNEIIFISCGVSHTFIHYKDGLYSFGWNESGQLGIGNKVNQLTPQRTPFNPNEVISVSCGGYHTFVHCKDGLYSFGQNNYGQLGIGNNHNQSIPQKTKFIPNKVISITCGTFHTFIHCKDGLYSFGNNKYGQLGNGNKKIQLTPQRTLFDPNEVISVSCGGYHTFVHCKGGLYFFGSNGYGQLGIEIKFKGDILIPQKISFIPHLMIENNSKESQTTKQEILNCISDQLLEMKDFTKHLFKTRENSDITIKNHQVHEAFIKAKCPQFLSDSTQIELKTMSDKAFYHMLEWMYTDELDCKPTIILEILKYSSITEMNALKQNCLEKLSLFINKNKYNAFGLLIESHKLSLKNISDKLIWLIGSNKLEIPRWFYYQKLPLPLLMKIIELSSLPLPKTTNLYLLDLMTSNKNMVDNLEAYSKLLNDEISADKSITVNSIPFYFHKFVLSPKWKYFNDTIVNTQNITIDLPLSAFQKVIEYFYVGLKTISIHDACWILQYSEKYHLTHKNLIDLCKYTTESIRLRNWKETLSFAINLKHKQLAINIFQEITKETVPKELFQHFVEKEADQQNQNQQLQQQIDLLQQQNQQLQQQTTQQIQQLQQQIQLQQQTIQQIQQNQLQQQTIQQIQQLQLQINDLQKLKYPTFF